MRDMVYFQTGHLTSSTWCELMRTLASSGVLQCPTTVTLVPMFTVLRRQASGKYRVTTATRFTSILNPELGTRITLPVAADD